MSNLKCNCLVKQLRLYCDFGAFLALPAPDGGVLVFSGGFGITLLQLIFGDSSYLSSYQLLNGLMNGLIGRFVF